MRREQFDHVVAAAAEVTGHDQFVVVGSQAILGSYEEPPDAMLESQEADIYPLHDPAAADVIDGALGDGSPFHLAYGYYAHGVGPKTAKAPSGWEARVVRRNVPARPGSSQLVVAWCLEPHDLVLAKCARGDERDWQYATDALRAGLVDGAVLLERVEALPLPMGKRVHITEMLRGRIQESSPRQSRR